MESKKRGLFSDWRVHVIMAALVIVAELIGIQKFKFGIISFSLLPMLFALVMGVILSQFKGLISKKDMETASPYIGITVMALIAWMGASVGPNLQKLFEAGPALILQEIGNLFTVLFALPVAVLLLKMDRTAVGSSFSISREGSLAIIGDLYGLDSPEGRGVMGSYITGTLLGTVFNSILASIALNIAFFHPESLAMAAGTGSASMMTAALAPIVEAFPDKAQVLSAYASSSQLLTSIDGPYIGIFVAIPFTNWLYKKLKGRQGLEAEKTKKVILKELSEEEKDGILLEEPEVVENVWFTRVKVLIISGIMAAVANYIMTSKAGKPVTPDQALPGLAIMAVIILFSYWVQEVLAKHTRINLPAIIYVSLITSVLCVPQLFGETSKFIVAKIMTVGLLPLCTPILAYAGIATGKDMAAFKQQGFKIILVSLLTFMGTFVGSALIAEVVMRLSGAF
ncbi:DUF3100 domain-containing protein [Proteiniclasticum sp. QWL-01]|uniref:DUF3100 domain-containing protein n=1 Tax=Proteiniclasticum sp. QWL-01 TaxID=3036945 RepID=UPI0021FC20D1|nr:DUF3100 domain-containing protein [Proteiniclasticum sp. QWL-01]UUM11440.1 DUF3100 domain-containing protein [Clostridiaceae bacterium HFYG-1003]WFF72852.1 DUF3100 domain-containing protein [Proteiniclasticum sp. QWL-01]